MLGTFFRTCPSIACTHSNKQFVPNVIKVSRLWCSLTQQDTHLKNALMKIIEPKQNELNNNESDQTAVKLPIRRRRHLRHPQSLSEAVTRSEFLRNMVDLGVNLYEIQDTRPCDFDFIMSLRSYDPDPPERIR